MKTAYRILLAGVVFGAAGCGAPGNGWRPADAQFQSFIVEALPTLLRDCGFHTCHGSSDRFFRVWGPGRVRLDPNTRAFDRLTADEWQASYQLALSMVDARNPGNSPLLRKPLAIAAGGSGHRGSDRFGRNIYRSTQDAGYQALVRWVFEQSAGQQGAQR